MKIEVRRWMEQAEEDIFIAEKILKWVGKNI